MRRWRLLVLLSCTLAAATAVPGARSADDPYAVLLAPSGLCGAAADQLNLDLPTAQRAMTCLTNYARTQSGLAPLEPNSVLDAAGQAKLAADVSCAEFSHTPCGQPFSAVFEAYLTGATSYAVGENIAWGTGSYGTPRQAMNGWLHSTGHRENVLAAAYREIGIGYVPGQSFQGYSDASLWSQEFGVRSPAPSTPATRPPASVQAPKQPVPKKTPHRKKPGRRLHR